MKIIDTHSHFNLSQFDGDREDAIARMRNAEVGTICVGVDEETSAKAIEIANTHDDMWAIVGQHPTEWHQEFNLHAFISLAREPKVVGIGECGLDYFRERERGHVSEQRKLFESQIALAKETNLPLMLHIRPMQGSMDAYEDALDMLQQWKASWPNMRGTAHFFVGTQEIAQRFLDLGFHISFSGVITIFPEYEDVVRSVPIERILPETDAPFAAPNPYRGKRNEPTYVVEVVKKIAELKNMPLETVQAQLLKNAQDIFIPSFTNPQK
jgi:TatD DNase family protein